MMPPIAGSTGDEAPARFRPDERSHPHPLTESRGESPPPHGCGRCRNFPILIGCRISRRDSTNKPAVLLLRGKPLATQLEPFSSPLCSVERKNTSLRQNGFPGRSVSRTYYTTFPLRVFDL